MRMRRLITLLAPIALAAGAFTPAARALPGQWAIPLGSIDGTNASWGLAPAGGTGTPANLFAIRVVAPSPAGFGGFSVEMPPGTTISDITALSFDSYYESGGCGGGSPRLGLRLDTDGDGMVDKNVFTYAGPFPNYTGCALGVWQHDDMFDGNPRFDSTQIGGPFYGTLAQAAALAPAGTKVLKVTYVWDSSWLFSGTSVIWVDNVRVNDFLLDEPGKGHVCSLAAGATGGPVCP